MIRYGGRYKDGFVFQLLVWVATALPTVFAQFYLEKQVRIYTKLDFFWHSYSRATSKL